MQTTRLQHSVLSELDTVTEYHEILTTEAAFTVHLIQHVALMHSTVYITLIFIYHIFNYVMLLLIRVKSDLWGGYPLTTNITPLHINGREIQVGCFFLPAQTACSRPPLQGTTSPQHGHRAPYSPPPVLKKEFTFLFQFRKRLRNKVNLSIAPL
jgi:hypothetical protein